MGSLRCVEGLLVTRDCGSLEASMDFDKLIGASSFMSMESQVSFLPNTREMTPVGGQQTHFASSREMLAFI